MSNFTVNPANAKKLIMKCMKHHQVPLLTSAPGMGKSDIIKSIAKEMKLKLIDVRLAQKESVDLGGMPDLSGEYATYKQFDEFPTEKTPVPDGYNGWLIFCDELTQAKRDVQGAFHKISLDRMVGQEHLNKFAFVVAAGNRTQDRAGSNGLITSLQSRLTHLELAVSIDDFLPYFMSIGGDPRITALLNFKNELLNNFDPLHTGNTYACSRTWHKLSIMTKHDTDLTADLVPLITGTVGEGAGAEYRNFCQIWQELAEFKDVVAHPDTAKLSSNAATNYAMVGMLASKVDADTLAPAVEYIMRMGPELQLTFLRMTSKAFMGALRVPNFQKLLTKFNKELKSYA
ncbi:P-loop containing nucleoside triphosphate hydrolase [Vibrio phage 1.238.A._10N.261.52.F10]|uniref:P-loop containing nucleoside triphosphate hydrolase n=1 Tax=Vibrio phage 1.238.A._10N.261.52.F10 TaxID=1881231 RepID=A0A2I7RUJ5_9CAUD|nr:ATPase [Vibrio phage 1.238.A._10N.261.52.F10]AUR97309.1 P-loop containing nucleoside triphosphate hydrolase [Vibrio phage 1.238.A._10N.261.52.F10]AUR97403.1 P-loop containing nucleoside triphosphate hydrolase [Vibrio phage 1.238.B._10N.261.52.F10]